MATWLLEHSKNSSLVLPNPVWKRCGYDPKTYDLYYDGRIPLSKVWKSGGEWACLDGTSWKTLKQAKANTESQVVAQFHTWIEELNARIDGLESGATTDDSFTASSFQSAVLTRLIDQRVNQAYLKALRAHGNTTLLGRASQPCNSLQATTIEGVTLFLLSTRLIHTYSGKVNHSNLLLRKAEIWASLHMADDTGHVMWAEDERNGSRSIFDFSEEAIDRAASELVEEGLGRIIENKQAA